MSRLFVTIVLDGVGVGAQPDADEYGDIGTDTLGHVCAHQHPRLPNLQTFGLGNIKRLEGIAPSHSPIASWGRLQETSAGKDSTTGHWELAGLHLDQPFPTYPDGIPADLVEHFLRETEIEGVLGGHPASGTDIIAEFGAEHMRSGLPIVYTSADSVFQIATHVEVVSLETLYRWCQIARDNVCVGKHAVGRVIARPFEGDRNGFSRISTKRKDFSRLPELPPLQSLLQQDGVHTVAIGKIADLFGGIGFDEMLKTRSNAHGMETLITRLDEYRSQPRDTFIWINLVDFDQEFGHRNDPAGFARALEEFDRALPELLSQFPSNQACMAITADHGNDPTTPGTDHTREYVPLLFWDPQVKTGTDFGLRPTFADHAATVSDFFGVHFPYVGRSFRQEIPA